jgi:drug/metabolite transporter (DMT)-like permease
MLVKHVLLGVIFALIWSSAFPSAKVAVQYAPPFFLLFFRFLFSGLFAIAVAKALGQNIYFSKKDWLSIVAFGVLQNSIYLGLIFLAVTKVEANVSVIIASILPLTVAIFSWLFLNTRISSLGIAGLLMGFSGVILIMYQRTQAGSEFLGVFLCFIALLATTLATIILSRINVKNENVLMIVGLQMLVGCITLLPISYFFEEWFVKWNIKFVLTFGYISLFPGIIAPLIWFYLQKEIGTVRFSSFHFLNPFFGVFLSFILLNELLSVFDFIGIIIVTLGLYLVQSSKKKISANYSQKD